MGDAALYDYRVELLSDDGVVSDVRTGRLGIRESAILEEPFTENAGEGRSFWLVVNGRRVFCKGGNWIPTELWPAAARDEQYRFYLRKSAEANCNMLRVWGGGVYEREIFYDLCDELGIMVWQDFMFASGGVPLESLRASIVREAMHQIRRLRSRPSVVLWCGCNEDVYSWSVPGDARTVDAMADMAPQESKQVADLEINRFRDDPALYTMLLRGLVGRHGLGVPYVESSPMSFNDAGNDKRSGNSHHSCLKYALFSTPEDRPEIRGHFEQVQSFDSEFCIHGPASEATMRRFLTEAHAWPPDDVWTYHIQRGHADLPYHVQTMRLAGGIFGPIGDLRTYVKHGQALHAEMMRAEFEFARRDRPNNGGTMMWMLNDCWPTANWSIIEYGRVPKPAYYAARRACAPVLPIVFERKGRIGFFVSNDGSDAIEVEVVLGRMTLAGVVREERRAGVTVPGVATVRVDEIERAALTGATGRATSTGGTGSASGAPALAPDEFLFTRLVRDGVAEPTVSYFVDGWKDVPWPEEKFALEVGESRRVTDQPCGTALRLCPSAEENWETDVRVQAESYLRMFHLDVQSDGFWWADDSFFDVVPGESRVVRIRSAQPLAPGAVTGRAWQSWE
jgi:beta-mannosidase